MANVITFGMAVGGASSADLEPVASNNKSTGDQLPYIVEVTQRTTVVQNEFPEELEITTVQTAKVVRDIVFLVDVSSYVGSHNLPFVKQFMTSVVNMLDVQPDRFQFGLMQFSERPKIELNLNSHQNKQDVLNRISQMTVMGGSVLNTGAAMSYALSNMFQASTGSRRRQNFPQVLILITGGPAKDEVKKVADSVALAGVLTYTHQQTEMLNST
ncbi:unnamed protein product [Merluccius merluccius]